ncbi:MAG: hypothetical protein ACRECO_13255 [Xanthobacteraceae bacterium]
MRRIIGFICITAALAGPATAQGTLDCRVTQKLSCAAGEGCTPVAATTWNVVDLARQTYARCDKKGCDSYPASLTRSGVFTVIDVPGRGMTAKIANSGGFLEVATIGIVALVSHGTCRER